MSKRFYVTIRGLHLYLGLFLTPFVLVFSLSVSFLAYSWLPGGATRPSQPRVVAHLTLPPNLGELEGRTRLDALQALLPRMGVSGEIGFVQHDLKSQTLSIPVTVPGRETTVRIDLAARSATVVQRETGIADALVELHKSPGPHLVDIRMNWWPMRVWRWFADGTVYLLFFISISGIYLWAVLRAERRIGLALIGAGVVTFLGVMYAIIH